MKPIDDDAPLRYLALELGPEGVAEWGERAHTVFVPRGEIVEMELRHGVAGKRPALQVLLGVAIIAGAGLLATALGGLFGAGFSGGAAPLTGACVPLMLLGGYIVWFALRPVLHLHVRLRRGARVLRFHGETDLASLAAVLADATRRFGYAIRWAVAQPVEVKTAYRSATRD